MPPFRLALELPPISSTPDGGRTASTQFAELVAIARAAEIAGFESIWIGSDPERGSLDPAVLAAGLLEETSRCRIGVIASGGLGRHPSLWARELSALDVIAPNRTGVLFELDWSASALQAVTEAASLLRGLLVGESISISGDFFSVTDAVNRPAPLAADAVFVAAAVGAAAFDSSEAAAELCSNVDALVGLDLEVLDTVRTMIDGAAQDRAPSLWWRTTLEASLSDQVLAALSKARVDGLICRMNERQLRTEMVSQIAELLAAIPRETTK